MNAFHLYSGKALVVVVHFNVKVTRVSPEYFAQTRECVQSAWVVWYLNLFASELKGKSARSILTKTVAFYNTLMTDFAVKTVDVLNVGRELT